MAVFRDQRVNQKVRRGETPCCFCLWFMLGDGSVQHTVPFQAPCHVCNTFDSRIEVPALRKIRSLWSSSAWGQPELYEAWSQKIMKWNKIKFKSVGHSAVYRTRLCELSHLECIVAQHLCYLFSVHACRYMHVQCVQTSKVRIGCLSRLLPTFWDRISHWTQSLLRLQMRATTPCFFLKVRGQVLRLVWLALDSWVIFPVLICLFSRFCVRS